MLKKFILFFFNDLKKINKKNQFYLKNLIKKMIYVTKNQINQAIVNLLSFNEASEKKLLDSSKINLLEYIKN